MIYATERHLSTTTTVTRFWDPTDPEVDEIEIHTTGGAVTLTGPELVALTTTIKPQED